MSGFVLHPSIFAVYVEKMKHPSVQTLKSSLPDKAMPGIPEATTIIQYIMLIYMGGVMEVIENRLSHFRGRWVLTLTTVCLVLLALSGCAKIGPRSISMGRGDYNQAISKTDDEQMLLAIISGCYGDSFSLLAVSGVAANVTFRANAGVNAGFGPEESYSGNLVPFSAGLAYEENPTITYVPVQGADYLRQLMSPIPLDLLVLFVRTGANLAAFFTLLAKRVNDLQNPNFIFAPSSEPDPRFKRFVELNGELERAGIIQWAADPKEEVSFDILIANYSPSLTEKVYEYMTLLGLSIPSDESTDIVLPVYLGIKGRNLDGIAISTRSTFDLIEILRAAIEIPQEHVGAGIAIDYPAPGPVGENIHIHSLKDKPKRAAVAVKYRGYWFYIDDSDTRTKLFYQIVRALWSVSIAEGSNTTAAPVLTIPVSR
jgi:hypothetical protein